VHVWVVGCRCWTPPGAGSRIGVRVTVNRLAGLPVFLWRYSPPAVYSVSPTEADPHGGTQITLIGLNFGPSGNNASMVTIDGRLCEALEWNHTRVVCIAPPGVSSAASVVVRVVDQAAPARRLMYLPPVVLDYSPRVFDTEGGSALTVVGERFLAVSPFAVAASLVADDGRELPCNVSLANATTLECTVPEGAGTGWTVTVTNVDPVAGERQASRSPVDQVGAVGRVVYAAPVVTALYHSVGASPATGGFPLVINGTPEPFLFLRTVGWSCVACSPIRLAHSLCVVHFGRL
jgi:hypothetical protein